MAENISHSTRKHIRNLKSSLRHEMTPQRVSSESVFWDKTQEILSLSLVNYSEKFAPHTPILKEFFTIRTQTSTDARLRTEKLNEFKEKHDREMLRTLSPAFAAINKIIEDQGF